MATSSMVPYSNPGGNNQTTPKSTLAPPTVASVPTVNPVNPVASGQLNPLIPATSTYNTTGNTGGVPVGTPTAQNAIDPAAYNQLKDIYGGTGDLFSTLLGSISGTSSAALQEYTQSLQPQMAQAGANLHASLGAGGVSENSSVASLGEANLQAQETADIAGETSKLTMANEDLEAKLIESVMPDAKQQVTDSSAWSIFGQVLGDIGGVASDFMGLGGLTGGLGLGKSAASVPTSGFSLGSGYGSSQYEG